MPPDDAARPRRGRAGRGASAADEAEATRRRAGAEGPTPRTRRDGEAAAAADAEATPPRRTPARGGRRATTSPDDRRRGAGADATLATRLRPRSVGLRRGAHEGEERGRLAVELVTIVAVALGLALGIQAFLVKPFRIPSESMVPDARGRAARARRPREPALQRPRPRRHRGLQAAGGRRRQHLRRRAPPATSRARGRPRTARTRTSSSASWPCGGDRLKVIDGRVYLNGKRQDEPFIAADADCGICNLPKRDHDPEGPLLHDGRQPRRERRQPRVGARSRRSG